ncbi:MAG: hypothetical protein PVI01_09050 [Gemmatimonadales bacterium]|jgi:hypothetical protein
MSTANPRIASPRRRLFVIVSAILVSLLPSASQLLAQAGTSDALPDVEIDLEGRVIKQTLPFDVPFLIHATIPQGTQKVRVQYAVSKTPIRVEKDTASGRYILPDELAWRPADPLTWFAVPGIDATPATFRVAMPPIDAQRHVVFKILVTSVVGEERAIDFREAVRDTLDAQLRPIASTNLSAAQTPVLRRSLVASLHTVTAADTVIAEGTIFDLNEPMSEVRLDFVTAVNDVLTPQVQRMVSLGDYATNQLRLKANLDRIRSDPALTALVERGESAAATNTSVAVFMRRYGDAVRLVKLDERRAASWSLGYDPALYASPPALDTIWNAREAGEVVSTYERLGGNLAQLREWLAMVLEEAGRNTLFEQLVEGDRPASIDVTALRDLASDNGAIALAEDDVFALVDNTKAIQNALLERGTALDRLADAVKRAAESVVIVTGATTGNYSTFKNYYVSVDAGLVYPFEIDNVLPYIGVNLYLRPVNKDAPLNGLARRFAITIGITVSSVSDGRSETRDDLFGSQALLLGAGLRLLPSVRAGAGALLFRKLDPNPLITRKSLASVPYVSLSLDWDIAKTLRVVTGNPP